VRLWIDTHEVLGQWEEEFGIRLSWLVILPE